jgi:hypothetical protein
METFVIAIIVLGIAWKVCWFSFKFNVLKSRRNKKIPAENLFIELQEEVIDNTTAVVKNQV